MSVYFSIFSIGDEHKNSCERIRKVGRKSYEQDDSKPCTCGSTPIKYQGSHILPSVDDERNGSLGFAGISPHITRNGKDNGTKPHPYLRFHLHGGYQDSLVLTRRQVRQLRDALSDWLTGQEGS